MTNTTIPTTTKPALWLTLQAYDANALIDFYTGAFGFTVAARYDDGDQVAHAELVWPEGAGGLMMGSHKPDAEWSTQPGTAAAYVVTGDPRAVRDRVVAHGGARSVGEPVERDYGSTEFQVTDPEGNRWSFGTHPGAG